MSSSDSSAEGRRRYVSPVSRRASPVARRASPVTRRASRENSSSNSADRSYYRRRRRDRHRVESDADLDPLTVAKSDNPGAQLIPVRLDGTNFFKWSHNVKMALGAKNKLGFIDGSCPRPEPGSRTLPRWVRADYMIRCWILNSMEGKFGAVFASIPLPIVAALYCLFFGYVGSVGLSYLQFCNLNSFRTKLVLGLSIFLGLSVAQYFNEYTAINGYGPVHTGARWFNDMVNVPFSSKAFVAAIVAYFLDNTLHKKEGAIRKDRGRHWWDKYYSFKGDARSEEFYSLPLNLNKYFPSA